MSTRTTAPVLVVGGSGTVGRHVARTLRHLHPDLPITIGGRDMGRAGSVAQAIGEADVAKVDLDRVDLGLPDDQPHSAVVTLLKDDAFHALRYAQKHGIPHIGISTGAFEIGPEVGYAIHRPASAPILMASNWLAGAATMSALHLAADFASVSTIEVSAVLDPEDVGGPAAHADFARQTSAGPSALLYADGRWVWADPDDAGRTFRGVDGREVRGQAFGNLDLLSLVPATDARSVRFSFALAETATRLRGEPFSTEIVIEVAGRRHDGSTRPARLDLVHPHGQAPVTAAGLAVAVERMLGLDGGAPVPPGLYLPNSIIAPAVMVCRLEELGARITTS